MQGAYTPNWRPVTCRGRIGEYRSLRYRDVFRSIRVRGQMLCERQLKSYTSNRILLDMVDRRQWARIVFLGQFLILLHQAYRWSRSPPKRRKSTPMSIRWLVAGAGFHITYSWTYDHDFGAIRTKRSRQIILGLPLGMIGFRTLSRSEAVWRSLSTGMGVGRICYRFWYGVLRPLPATDS